MHRQSDETGVSGIGKVLEGVVFSDGVTVIRWLVSGIEDSTSVWPSVEAFKAVHIDPHPTNHTLLIWHDEIARD